MPENKSDMNELPPLNLDEIRKCLQSLNASQDTPEKKVPVLAIGDRKAAIVTPKASDVAEPWVRDAKAHGPALQAAIDRYNKVYSDMGLERKMHTCIDKRQGAMTAAIELYCTLVAEQQSTSNALTVEDQPAPASPGLKGLLVAVAYHNKLSKACLDEADRLFLAYEDSKCEETRMLAKIAHENSVKHMQCASDMMHMAMGEKPVLIDDPLDEFAMTMARLLG